MPLDVGVFAYEGVPIELAQAAASELEQALDFVDLHAYVEPLSEIRGKEIGLIYDIWVPPTPKSPLKLNFVDDDGRDIFRKKIKEAELEFDRCRKDFSKEELSRSVYVELYVLEVKSKKQNFTDNDIKLWTEEANKDYDALEEERGITEKKRVLKRLKGEYVSQFPNEHPTIDWIKIPSEIYNLRNEHLRMLENCIVYDNSSERFVAVDLIPPYKQAKEVGIKIIADDVNLSNFDITCKGRFKNSAVISPFIEISSCSTSYFPEILPYFPARGFINVARGNSNAPNIGEAVYFWNKGEKQIATDWATYCLVHEFGGHTIGGLRDIFLEEYKTNWSVMRAPLNALTLQEEIRQYGRDTRLRFRPEDRTKIAENVKVVYAP